MYKKSQGLSLNIIIIAAIGLIVLIILAFIFRGESGKFVKSTSCSARNGKCLTELTNKEKCPEDKPIKIYTNDCKEIEFKDGIYQAKKDRNGKDIYPGQCCIPLT